MASNESDEPSSPPVVVRRKILDSASEITSKKDYERLLKIQTRKRSLSPTKEKLEEPKVEEPSPKKKKQKIRHETSSSEELPKIYHCHHVYCDWPAADKSALDRHHADEAFHEEHLNQFQLFCETCQNMVNEKGWTDVNNQTLANAARQQRSEINTLIRRLEILQEKKVQFKKAEEEFIYRNDQDYRPEMVAVPGIYSSKFKNEPAKIELPNGVQEFELLLEQWKTMNYFKNIHSTELDSIPVVAEVIIEKYKAKEYTVQNLQLILKGMKDLYKRIQNDEVYKQWLLFNMCKLKLFMNKNGLKAKATKMVPINSPTQVSPWQQQLIQRPMTPNLNPMQYDPKFLEYMVAAMMNYFAAPTQQQQSRTSPSLSYQKKEKKKKHKK